MVCGTEYGIGDVIVTDVCELYGGPVFGKILSIDNNRKSFRCQTYESYFDAHYHSWEIDCLSEENVSVEQTNLIYKPTASLVRLPTGRSYLSIRHSVI